MTDRRDFCPGSIAVVDAGYHSGIWLRSEPDVGRSDASFRISPGSCVLIVEVRGDSVLVVGEECIIGWTWKSRLSPVE